MKDCCLSEAKKHLKRHGQVARCDACGALVLAYGKETHYQSTVEELTKRGVAFETARVGELWVIAKPQQS